MTYTTKRCDQSLEREEKKDIGGKSLHFFNIRTQSANFNDFIILLSNGLKLSTEWCSLYQNTCVAYFSLLNTIIQ